MNKGIDPQPIPQVAIIASEADKNVLPPALLDAIAAELTKSQAVVPIWLRCGNENVVLIRDPHDYRRGKRNRYSWTRHANEDKARFFWACAPGHQAAATATAAKESRDNG